MNIEKIQKIAKSSKDILFKLDGSDKNFKSVYSSLYEKIKDKNNYYSYLSESNKFIKIKGIFFIKKEYGINNLKVVNKNAIVEIWENNNFSYEIEMISNRILKPINKIKTTRFNFPKDYVIIDNQTTGIDTNNDKIIAIGMIIVEGGKIIEKKIYYVDPELSENEIEIYQSAQKFSGKSPFSISKIKIPGMKGSNENFIKEKDIIKIIFNKINKKIIVGHNLNFEIKMINSLFRRNHVKTEITVENITTKQICTLKELQKFEKVKNNSLDGWIKKLGLESYDRELYHDPLKDSEILFNLINNTIK